MIIEYTKHEVTFRTNVPMKTKEGETSLEYGQRIHRLFHAGKLFKDSKVYFTTMKLQAGNKPVYTTLN